MIRLPAAALGQKTRSDKTQLIKANVKYKLSPKLTFPHKFSSRGNIDVLRDSRIVKNSSDTVARSQRSTLIHSLANKAQTKALPNISRLLQLCSLPLISYVMRFSASRPS